MRDALQDVRSLLEESPSPLSVSQMLEQLEGTHQRVVVEHLLEHFRLEGQAAATADGHWGWLGRR